MKSNLLHIAKLISISCVVGLFCTIGVYRFFPQYLCYNVYNASENDLYEKEDKLIESNEQYKEIFTPTADYIKCIEFYAKGESEKDSQYVTGKLIDAAGKLIVECMCEIKKSESGAYCTFDIEKWIEPGVQYQFIMDFSECSNLYVTFGPSGLAPVEHVKLLKGNEEVAQSMYLRYVYGCYSKKLLTMWFLAFFVCAYMLVEWIFDRGKEKV